MADFYQGVQGIIVDFNNSMSFYKQKSNFLYQENESYRLCKFDELDRTGEYFFYATQQIEGGEVTELVVTGPKYIQVEGYLAEFSVNTGMADFPRRFSKVLHIRREDTIMRKPKRRKND